MAEKFVSYRTEGSAALKSSSVSAQHEASIISFPYIQHSRTYQGSNKHYDVKRKHGIVDRLMADPLFGSMKATRQQKNHFSHSENKIIWRYFGATFVFALAVVLFGA